MTRCNLAVALALVGLCGGCVMESPKAAAFDDGSSMKGKYVEGFSAQSVASLAGGPRNVHMSFVLVPAGNDRQAQQQASWEIGRYRSAILNRLVLALADLKAESLQGRRGLEALQKALAAELNAAISAGGEPPIRAVLITEVSLH